MRDWYGMPLPPGLEIIKLTFSSLREYVDVFVNYTGQSAWGTGGVHNYIVARLLAHPSQDVDALYREFLDRAYGKEAAKLIGTIYTISDRELSRYVRSHHGHRQPPYDATYELVAKHYAPHFKEFESLYTRALAAAKTEAQRKRLEMFGQCLTVLHYNLRCAKLVDKPEQSVFYKSHDDYKAFIEANKDSLALGAHMKPYRGKEPRILFAREDRTLRIPLLPPDVEAPKIDGTLDDVAWTRAVKADGFRLRGTKVLGSQLTEVRLAFDRKNLYIAAQCAEAVVSRLKKQPRKRDSAALFEDDTFELFLSNKGNFTHNYWHVAFNALGSYYDNVALERDYNLEFTRAASIGKDAWCVEIAIPFKSLGLGKPPLGKTWRGNFCRIRKGPPREVSSWSGVEEGFHEPKSFGKWLFASD
jgi:cellulose/xylan binding protein with CBM9 domain